MGHERTGHTLTPTALDHEAYLRVADRTGGFESRRHFYNAAAQAMRRILVEHARGRCRDKRGGEAAAVSLDALDPQHPVTSDGLDWLALDEALEALAARDPRRHQVVMLRFFAGLGEAEVQDARRRRAHRPPRLGHRQALAIFAVVRRRPLTALPQWSALQEGPSMSDNGTGDRVMEILADVLDAPEAERAGLLDRTCAGQPKLRADVERLLGLGPMAKDFLEAFELPRGTLALPGPTAVGGGGDGAPRFGRYRTLRL